MHLKRVKLNASQKGEGVYPEHRFRDSSSNTPRLIDNQLYWSEANFGKKKKKKSCCIVGILPLGSRGQVCKSVIQNNVSVKEPKIGLGKGQET